MRQEGSIFTGDSIQYERKLFISLCLRIIDMSVYFPAINHLRYPLKLHCMEGRHEPVRDIKQGAHGVGYIVYDQGINIFLINS